MLNSQLACKVVGGSPCDTTNAAIEKKVPAAKMIIETSRNTGSRWNMMEPESSRVSLRQIKGH